MGKVRVYSLAQELDIKSNVLLDWLKEMGNEVQSHMSAIEDDIAVILRNRAKQLQSSPKAKEVEPVREVTKPAAAEMQKEVRSNTVKENQPREDAKKDSKPQQEAQPQPEGKPQQQNNRPQNDGRPQQNNRPQNDNRPQQNNRPQNDGRPQQNQQNGRPQNEVRTQQEGRPQQNNRPQNDGRPQQSNRPQNDGRPQQSNRPQNDGRPQQNNRPQNDGGPQQNNRPQNDGRPQQNNRPQNDGRPQQSNRPQNDGRPQQSNRPQNDGRPQQNSRPQNDGRPQQSQQNGRPQNDGRPQQSQQNGRPQNDFRNARPGNGQEQRRDGRPNQPDMKKDSRPQNTDARKDVKPTQPKTAAPTETRDTRENRDKGRDAKFESVEKRKEKQHQDGAGKKDVHTPGQKANSPRGAFSQPDTGREVFAAEVAEEISAVPSKKVLEIELPVTVKTLAEGLNVNPNMIIAKLIGLGVMATINQNLDPEAIELIADEFGYEVVFKTQEDKFKLKVIEDRPEDMQPRPPIVTIMGHVDHGKTSLLDVIRHTKVTATEAGGITQHIGAYQATINGKKITFLDTPGHEAFTAMRARGAQLTDIAVLVVAADDGVMPQTIEAINHAKAAGIQIIVAVNKIDKDNANPDRVLQELSEHGLIPESWGGDTICVYVSALKKINIEGLLEMIILVAELQEMKANPNRPADGVVVEAELDKGRGPVATVLVKRGTLKVGDPIVAGTTFGRVRAMINDKGERVEKASPATPVVVLGLSDVPSAGDSFEVADDDKIARAIADERAQKKRLEEMQTKRAITLDDLFKHIKEGEVKDLNLIIKADVQGSVEAVRNSLVRLSTEEVRVTPIHTGVGAVTESDVMLANTSNAIIIGFNVRPDLNARKMAERDNVEIRTYRIIYQAIEEVKAALEGLLEPEHKEVVIGRAEVRAVFKVPKIGSIAGMYVTDGKITRNANVRLLRNGIVIHEGKISSLKRFQDDVKEVAQSYECGLGIEGYNDIKEGDEVEVYVIEEIRRTLD